MAPSQSSSTSLQTSGAAGTRSPARSLEPGRNAGAIPNSFRSCTTREGDSPIRSATTASGSTPAPAAMRRGTARWRGRSARRG